MRGFSGFPGRANLAVVSRGCRLREGINSAPGRIGNGQSWAAGSASAQVAVPLLRTPSGVCQSAYHAHRGAPDRRSDHVTCYTADDSTVFCSSHTTGNFFISIVSDNPLGSSPVRIASTMSGARSVSRTRCVAPHGHSQGSRTQQGARTTRRRARAARKRMPLPASVRERGGTSSARTPSPGF